MLHTFAFGDDVNNKPDKLGIRTQGLQNALAFDPENKKIIAVGGNWLSPDSLATVFDLTAKKAIFTTRPHRGMIWTAVFSPDGKTLVTTGHDGTLKVFDVARGEEGGTFKGHDWVVTAAAFAPDGKTVASVCCNSKKRSIRLWNPLTLRESLSIPLPEGRDHIHDLKFSPGGKQIAGVSNWRFHAWDAESGKQLADAVGDGGLFTRLAYASDGKRLAIAGRRGGGDGKGILRLYDFTTKKAHLVFAEVPQEIMENIKGCATDALKVLGAGFAKADPAAIVEAIDDFAYRWQKGDRSSTTVVEDGEEARLIFGSLWREQLVNQRT